MTRHGARGVDQERPKIRKLTRREVLGYGAALAGGVAGAVLGWTRLVGARRVGTPEGFKVMELPASLIPNPAFSVRQLPNGGALAWVHCQGGSTLAYELNAPGRRLWQLCNGQRSHREVCSEFTRALGRPETEAREFLTELERRALVVEGGYVVIPAGAVVRVASDAS